ncbi:hypothetical protein JCM5353_008541 [Sporobolomyces roseus]
MTGSNRSFNQTSKASTSTQPYDSPSGTQKFVIGKIDAGIAVLISDSVHLIEFPSLLLPSGVGPGSIVNIACTRNTSAEKSAAKEFWDLQREIKECFGEYEPEAPKLRIRNTTQTSVTLEWDKLNLASATLISLSIYRNNQRLTTIPSPLTNTSTKLSGLQLDTDYTFHLVLKTTAGTYSSPIVKTRTHTIDNTSGISVCFGLVEPKELLEQAKEAVREMGAKWDDKIQIDTTHFVATSSASRNEPRGGPGVEYQKAIQLSIPVVSPEWILSCQRSSKLVPISAFYLGTTNHAASLSSAQLVSPTPPPPVNRQITQNTPSMATTKEEEEPIEPGQVEKQQKAPVQLEEAVEEPPEEQRASRDEERKVEEVETDSSNRAVKSEVEEERKPEQEEEVLAQAPTSTKEEKEDQFETPTLPAQGETLQESPEDAETKLEQPDSLVEALEPEETKGEQESVDLDDAFEESEIRGEDLEEVDVDSGKTKEERVDEDEGEGEGEGEKSFAEIEL